jgi:hypothetical protein
MIIQNSYKKLEKITWAEAPCVITGAGPSLFNYDISEYYSCHFISVNSSILKYNWQAEGSDNYLRAWVSNDSLCRKWSYYEKVLSDKCEKIVRDSWIKYEKELINFLYFSPRKTKEDIILADDDGLAYNSSVPTSIDLAIKLGFKTIYLLGIDHKSIKNKTHFWQFLPISEQPKEKIINNDKSIFIPPARIMQPENLQKNAWNTNIKVFESLNNLAKLKNVNIYTVENFGDSLPFVNLKFNNSGLSNYGIKFMPILKNS